MHITVRSIDVHYQEVVAGVPVISLHGWPAEHGQMLAMMEPLFARRQGWRRIYVDLPGMGKTPGADWLTSHDLMLKLIAEFIEPVAGERAALVGHSYGAQLVRGAPAARHWPICGCAAAVAWGDGRVAAAARPVVLAEEPGFVAALRMEKPFLDLFVVRTMPVLDIVRAQAMPGVLAAGYNFLSRIDAGPSFSYLSEVPRPFPGPELICSGRQEPGGYQHLPALLQSYPRSTCAILDRAGHLLFAEQPRLFQALTSEWLYRAEEYLDADTSNGPEQT
ncbi:MAG TPA: alpha/beta hydrolase [Propionibacteriaceae bacterium]|nr:alpha/beta hydrolase [Propionibacteriaceae bacterium]